MRRGGAGADAGLFCKWLTARNHLTKYQASVLLGRSNEPLWLGPYRVHTRIVQGRMAGIYKAVHAQGPTVAIKVLPPSRAEDPKVRARFQREARLAARLRHPNVVRTLDSGEENGVPYLVMEYLEGQTLKECVLIRGRLPLAGAMRLMYQALQGLQHIHEAGMVHRDLGPDNLMLVTTGIEDPGSSMRNRTLKILDIGLGRALFDVRTADPANPVDLTAEGEQLGTADFRSPEQAEDPRTVDIRSDIYSLGCVFYFILVGDTPFVERNPVNLIVQHATQAPSPLRQFGLSVPDGLQEVLDRMLEKDPALRYPTPEKAAQDLRPFLTSGK